MINKLLGIPENAAQHGVHIDQMLELVHWFMLVLFVGWSLFFVYVMFRFHRSRNPKASYYGAKTKITTHIEISVIVIEAMLLLGFAFPLWAKRVNEFPMEEAIRVRVIAQQFLWNFHYPGPDGKFGKQSAELMTADNPIGLDLMDAQAKDDIVVTNNMTLPVNKPVIMELMSKDVIHNVALPSMRIQHDAIPGSNIPMWFTPVKTSDPDKPFEIICAQLCGLGHYNMRGSVAVVTQEEYDKWIQSKLPEELRTPVEPKEAPVAPEGGTAAVH